MVIKDKLIEPFYIERDYNGYYLMDSRDKSPKKLTQKLKLEELLTDIVNRKIGESSDVTDLRGYVVRQQKLYLELSKVLDVKDEDVTSKETKEFVPSENTTSDVES